MPTQMYVFLVSLFQKSQRKITEAGACTVVTLSILNNTLMRIHVKHKYIVP